MALYKMYSILGPPRIRPDAFECADDAGRHEMPLVLRHVRQQIEGDGEFQVRRIKINQMIGSPARDVIQQFLGQIAVRVNQADAMPQRDVLDDHVSQHRGLAGTGFADDINVLPQIRQGNAERNGVPPNFLCAD